MYTRQIPELLRQLVGSCRNVTFKNVEISGYQTPTAIAGFIPNGGCGYREISNTHVINGTFNQVENGRDHWSTGSVGGIVGDMRVSRESANVRQRSTSRANGVQADWQAS